VSTGYCTWYELAQQIASDLAVSPSLQRTSVFDRPQKAQRPQFCALSNAKLAARGIVMPHWQNAIGRHVRMRRPAPTILSIGNLASARVG
jgi:dTDP-4-dehydrorhamnose reductase